MPCFILYSKAKLTCYSIYLELFYILAPYWIIICKYLLPFGRLFVLSVASFTLQKVFILIQYHFFLFIYVSLCLQRHIQKDIAKMDVKKSTASVFLLVFDDFRSYTEVFISFLFYFCVWCEIVVQLHFFFFWLYSHPFFQHLLLKRLLFLQFVLLARI